MTFVLGMNFNNGIVVASDSLETDGYNKRFVDKICKYVVQDDWGVIVSCAGGGDVIRKFVQRLRDTLGNGSYDRTGIEQCIQSAIDEINQRHPGELEVVVGIFGGVFDASLYRTYPGRICLTPEDGYACAGMDTTLANFILSSLFNPLADLEEAKRVAVFTLQMMKKYTHGVEGPTHVVTHSRGEKDFRRLPEQEIEALEKKVSDEALKFMTRMFWRAVYPLKEGENLLADLGRDGILKPPPAGKQ